MLAILILFAAIRAPSAPGRRAFTLSVTFALWWTICVLYRHSVTDYETRFLLCQLAWFGIMATPLYWSLSFLTYARGRELEKTWQLVTVGIIAAVFGILALTNDWHQSLYISLIDETTMLFEHGWIYNVGLIFAYSTMATACLYGTVTALRSNGIHRWQLWALLASAILPWLGNISYTIYGFTLFNDDPTPFLFTATGAFMLGAQLFGQLFVLPPIGRDAMFAMLPDPVLVLDEKGRILELNPAAARLPGVPAQPIGKNLTDASELNTLLQDGCCGDGLRHEVRLAANGLTYELSCHSLAPWGRDGGRMVVLRDISLRKADAQRLAALSRDLETRLEENVRLQTLLRDEASRDHLTGLYNRRHAQTILPALFERERAGMPLSLLIVDIDHFKMFNDRFGHQTGDAVLQIFANILRQGMSGEENVFRWGGEEFLVVLPGADRQTASERAEHWRAQMPSITLPDVLDMNITFSAGLCEVTATMRTTLEDAVKAADKALYAAKAAGRNRLIVFGDEATTRAAGGKTASVALIGA
ncbi:diguanylate cyclase [Rhizobium sp. FY34]|uniref:diguanylate cyclase domain-containing protein n=1 Tax=Rhizobium sp. FY34 TaxID=2562309 RepID=UPI0010C149F3|nr:diguanylate cyclase [Rhizobium sp. FY34]